MVQTERSNSIVCLQGIKKQYMEGNLPLHRLDRRAQAVPKARLSDETRGVGLGTGTA